MMRYFYGEGKTGPYFEGWYFKCQTREGHSIALIPALHIDTDGKQAASIQVITEDNAWWLAYPGSSFSAQTELFRVEIGGNVFSEKGMELDLCSDEINLAGKIVFGPFCELKSDIMGPFRWVPNMECSHAVISMSHALRGQVVLNGTVLDFAGGIGYIESDRGHSFPSAYLWTQSNWDGGSFMLSIARIPYGKMRFTGCICAFYLDGQEHRIATYLGARVRAWSSRYADVRQGRYRVEIELIDKRDMPLKAPCSGSMVRTVHESVGAKVRIRVWRGGHCLVDRIADQAGFEYSDGSNRI